MPATWLADALRAGGCTVDETVVPDWKVRGHTDGPRMDVVHGVVGHHTAGPATGDLPSLATVRDGRPDLAGPLANLMLSRAGVWVPIAAGRCWHAGAADRPAAWPWVPSGDANGYCIGIEAESAGTGDWTPAQLDAYPRGVAALLAHAGLTADRFLGHLEWAPSRKTDPHGWPGGLAGFRATVTDRLTPPAALNPRALEDVVYVATQLDDPKLPVIYAILSGGVLTGLDGPSATSAQANIKAGCPVQWVSKTVWEDLDTKSKTLLGR
jgi:hypothetical protein